MLSCPQILAHVEFGPAIRTPGRALAPCLPRQNPATRVNLSLSYARRWPLLLGQGTHMSEELPSTSKICETVSSSFPSPLHERARELSLPSAVSVIKVSLTVGYYIMS